MILKSFGLAGAGLWALTSVATAGSVTVADTTSDVSGVAAATTALLLDAGLAVRNVGAGKFVVAAKDVHCDQRSNGPLDASDPHAGLPTLVCRIDARNERDTKTGKVFGNSRALLDLLDKVQASSLGANVQFGDCAMGGYCGTYLKSIACTIDTKVEDFSVGGRWSCTFVDGQ